MQPKRQPVSYTLPPAAAGGGNTLIVLDSGEELHAHSFWLEAASEVFRTALTCTPTPGRSTRSSRQVSPDAAASRMQQLPLPGVSKHQALLLLHCLYAWANKDWVGTLSQSDLLDLARIADKYACARVLELVDSTLVQQCRAAPSPPGCLSPDNAPAQFQLARDLHLEEYEGEIAQFLGMHASQVDLSKLDKTLANVLRGASKSHAELLSSLLRA